MPSAVGSASGSVVFDADSPVDPGFRECIVQASRRSRPMLNQPTCLVDRQKPQRTWIRYGEGADHGAVS
jgi:hypothetical protein